MPKRESWEIAGIVDQNGILDRPVLPGWWFVPARVELQGNEIRWGNPPKEDGAKSDDNLLDQFLRLSKKTPSAVRGFIAGYGPLALGWLMATYLDKYRRGIPEVGCRQFAESLFGVEFVDGLGDGKPFSDDSREPASLYIAVSTSFETTLNRIADLYSENITNEDWALRHPFVDEWNPWGRDRAIADLELLISRLMEIAQVQPGLRWNDDDHCWSIELSHPTVFGALVFKLAMAAARAETIYNCSGCGGIFVRSGSLPGDSKKRRKPKEGQRKYCADCQRANVPGLDAKRDYRRRMSEARERYLGGESLRTIASDMGISLSRAKKWALEGKANGEKKTR